MPGTVEKWKWKLEGWWSVVGFGLAMLWERECLVSAGS